LLWSVAVCSVQEPQQEHRFCNQFVGLVHAASPGGGRQGGAARVGGGVHITCRPVSAELCAHKSGKALESRNPQVSGRWERPLQSGCGVVDVVGAQVPGLAEAASQVLAPGNGGTVPQR
jgi:hypothetical protein